MNKTSEQYRIRDILKDTETKFRYHGVESPEVSAIFLLSGLLGISRNMLLLIQNKEINRTRYDNYLEFVSMRITGKPIDYILGNCSFMGLKLKVNENTLIPRPETELLTQEGIDLIRNKKNPSVLDIGTGCGNIAIAVAKILNAKVTAIDNSKDAIKVAEDNAIDNSVDNMIKFVNISMEEYLKEPDCCMFDMIITNPPYIEAADYAVLSKEVQMEPRTALIAGKDGLKYIRTILKYAIFHLKKTGVLLLEIGYNQSGRIAELLNELKIKKYAFKKDLNGLNRILIIYNE